MRASQILEFGMQHESFRRVLFHVVLNLALLTPLIGTGLWAQKAAPAAPDKRDDGEADRIQRRLQWFFYTRHAGADRKLSDLREAAVAFTRGALRDAGASSDYEAWTSRGPASSTFGGWKFGNVSGRTIALAKDWTNNILYAGGASGGLWKSTDDGMTWTPLFDAVGTTTVGVITLDPSHPGVIWVGTGENSMWCEDYFGIGLLRSSDGGRTWEKRNGAGASTLGKLSAFASVVVDGSNPNHLVVGGRYSDCVDGNYYWGGLYTTDDAGMTWTCRVPNAGITEIVQDPVRPEIFWAGAENIGVLKSTDGGITWKVQTASGLPAGETYRVEVAVSPVDSNIVYALFAYVGDNYSPEFWRTTDGGGTWMRMSKDDQACDGQCDYNMVIRADKTSANTVYRGTVHIFKSADGGATWADLSGQWGPAQKVHQDTHDFLMDPSDPNTFYVGCDGGIWKTSDGGRSFTNLNGNLVMTQFYAVGTHPTDDGILIGGCQDNSSLARTASDTWDMAMETGDGFVSLINPAQPNMVFTTSYPSDTPSIFRSSTGVLGNYRFISGANNGFTSGDRINWVTPYAISASDPATLYCGTQRIYRSTNNGNKWTKLGPDDLTGGGAWDSIACVEIHPADANRVWAGTTDGHLWTTADGSTWTDTSATLPVRAINDIAADPFDPTKAFCVVGGFNSAHLWEYTGTEWQERGGGLPNVPANTVLLLSATDLFVGTDVGVFRSVDRGRTFSPYIKGMPLGAVVTDLKYNATTGTLTAATYGRGVWQITPHHHDRPAGKP